MMRQPLRQMVLFQPPRMAEERHPYWSGQHSQAAVASGLQLRGLGAEEGGVTGFFNALHSNVMDFVSTLTGQKAQSQAQERVLELQRLQAEQKAASAAFWTRATPWLAVGGVAAVGLLVIATRK